MRPVVGKRGGALGVFQHHLSVQTGHTPVFLCFSRSVDTEIKAPPATASSRYFDAKQGVWRPRHLPWHCGATSLGVWRFGEGVKGRWGASPRDAVCWERLSVSHTPQPQSAHSSVVHEPLQLERRSASSCSGSGGPRVVAVLHLEVSHVLHARALTLLYRAS